MDGAAVPDPDGLEPIDAAAAAARLRAFAAVACTLLDAIVGGAAAGGVTGIGGGETDGIRNPIGTLPFMS